jgi:hypothetical protein
LKREGSDARSRTTCVDAATRETITGKKYAANAGARLQLPAIPSATTRHDSCDVLRFASVDAPLISLFLTRSVPWQTGIPNRLAADNRAAAVGKAVVRAGGYGGRGSLRAATMIATTKWNTADRDPRYWAPSRVRRRPARRQYDEGGQGSVQGPRHGRRRLRRWTKLGPAAAAGSGQTVAGHWAAASMSGSRGQGGGWYGGRQRLRRRIERRVRRG